VNFGPNFNHRLPLEGSTARRIAGSLALWVAGVIGMSPTGLTSSGDGNNRWSHSGEGTV
jgi:hypothetical protein